MFSYQVEAGNTISEYSAVPAIRKSKLISKSSFPSGASSCHLISSGRMNHYRHSLIRLLYLVNVLRNIRALYRNLKLSSHAIRISCAGSCFVIWIFNRKFQFFSFSFCATYFPISSCVVAPAATASLYSSIPFFSNVG